MPIPSKPTPFKAQTYTITTPCSYNHAETPICQPKFGFVRKWKKSELNHSISWHRLDLVQLCNIKPLQILKNTKLFSAILQVSWPMPAPSWPALCRPRTGRHFAGPVLAGSLPAPSWPALCRPHPGRHFAGPVLAGTLPAVFWPALVFLSTADICLRKSSITEYLFWRNLLFFKESKIPILTIYTTILKQQFLSYGSAAKIFKLRICSLKFFPDRSQAKILKLRICSLKKILTDLKQKILSYGSVAAIFSWQISSKIF